MKRIFIDASVVIKWYLPDEKYGQAALEILDKYVSYEVELLAPSLLEYEVLNGLLIASKRGRIQEIMVSTAVEGFLNLEIEQKDISFFILRFSVFLSPIISLFMIRVTWLQRIWKTSNWLRLMKLFITK